MRRRARPRSPRQARTNVPSDSALQRRTVCASRRAHRPNGQCRQRRGTISIGLALSNRARHAAGRGARLQMDEGRGRAWARQGGVQSGRHVSRRTRRRAQRRASARLAHAGESAGKPGRRADVIAISAVRPPKGTPAASPPAPAGKAAGGRSPIIAVAALSKAIAENGRPLILDAALRGQADAIRQLITNGANLASRDDDGNTAVALAAGAGQTAALDVLLGAGAEPDARNNSGETPLMLAAAKGHPDVVERLLEKHADIAAATPAGASALSMAVRGCHEGAITDADRSRRRQRAGARGGRDAAHARHHHMPRNRWLACC